MLVSEMNMILLLKFSEDLMFKSKLDEASLKKAREELNENEDDRISIVQSFRNLIFQENWLRTPTGTTNER